MTRQVKFFCDTGECTAEATQINVAPFNIDLCDRHHKAWLFVSTNFFAGREGLVCSPNRKVEDILSSEQLESFTQAKKVGT